MKRKPQVKKSSNTEVKQPQVMLVKIVADAPAVVAKPNDVPVSYVAGKALNSGIKLVASGVGSGIGFIFNQIANFGKGVVGAEQQANAIAAQPTQLTPQ